MDDRAVSTVVSYALILGITTLLASGLVLSMGGHVEREQQKTARSALEVVGNDLAADIDAADRLALTAKRSGTVELTTTLPERVAGSPYTVNISQSDGAGRYEITLRSIDPEESVTVFVRTQVPIETTTIDGGELTITYDSQRDTLVVRDG